MKVNILTLYPDMFPGCLGYSLAGKALAEGKWSLNVVNIRDFATDHYKSVDDTPFGGGAGMVMKPDVLDAAIAATWKTGPLYYLSPRGQTFVQQTAIDWARESELTFLCGRFEGIDERILEKWPLREISIGDFVLSGGEPALLTMLDAVIRLLPDVMGNTDSAMEKYFISRDTDFMNTGLMSSNIGNTVCLIRFLLNLTSLFVESSLHGIFLSNM